MGGPPPVLNPTLSMKTLTSLTTVSLVLVSFLWSGCRRPADPPTATEAPAVLAGDREREEENRDAHPHGAQVRFAQRLSADGTVPHNALWKMKQQRDRMLANQPEHAGGLLHNWKWLGPGNIGGRVRALCIHPTTPTTMWAGCYSNSNAQCYS